MIDPINILMYEKAQELQYQFADIDNRVEEGFVMWFWQYPDESGEMKGRFGLCANRSEDYPSGCTKVVWLPERKHLERFIPHRNLVDLDSKFTDFKEMFYESHWFSNDIDSLEGRGEDPLDYFKTYDELWLGFVMIDRFWKRWDGKEWVNTDIFPDYFDTTNEIARRDGYPSPDFLEYVIGLRGCTQ